MSTNEPSKEEQILQVMKHVLTRVAKDTATEPGMKHPLSPETIDDIRHCLLLISTRERELREGRGDAASERPRFKDEPKPQGDVVIPITKIGRAKKSEE